MESKGQVGYTTGKAGSSSIIHASKKGRLPLETPSTTVKASFFEMSTSEVDTRVRTLCNIFSSKKKDLLQNKICNQASNINKVINQQSSKSLSANLRMASVLKHLHNLFFTDPVLNKMSRLKKKDRNHCT